MRLLNPAGTGPTYQAGVETGSGPQSSVTACPSLETSWSGADVPYSTFATHFGQRRRVAAITSCQLRKAIHNFQEKQINSIGKGRAEKSWGWALLRRCKTISIFTIWCNSGMPSCVKEISNLLCSSKTPEQEKGMQPAGFCQFPTNLYDRYIFIIQWHKTVCYRQFHT